ncbi:hypothetical protein B0H10DRAFT_1870011 [Mycena sp. CBHHK59/15]|nr:hypothetical protein B0H10DRAFT_1870011 [Mycena sp. CBHHK59/15]
MAPHSLPYHPHTHTDLPLYAVADLTTLSHSQRSAEASIVFDRISSRGDNDSTFFKALCGQHHPTPLETVEDQHVSVSTVVAPSLPVDWSRKEPPRQRRGPAKPLPKAYPGDVLQKAIYAPHGKWKWTTGLPFKESASRILLSSGVMCSAFLKTGKIGDREVKYVSKVWLTKEEWYGFFSELALYKVQLKPLQGHVVPAIINVYSYPGAVDVAMEPPHHSFWIEASSDMPHVLKKRCVQAFEKLHACGVYHGDIELRHMLIGGDAKVTIIDFQASRALIPNEAIQLGVATPEDLQMEMRKVKFKLDYEGARAWEDEKLMRHARLTNRNKARARGAQIEEALEEDKIDPPIDTREWNLEWIGAPVEPTRFVMPGQSTADLENAVEHFLLILDKLEKEECLDGGAIQPPKPSPDFAPPAPVKKQPTLQTQGRGFGATVVHPSALATRALKRPGVSDHPQEPSKRICLNASGNSTTSPGYIKVRDFAYDNASTPSKVATGSRQTYTDSLCESLASPCSPGKRKREEDGSETLSDMRGLPKIRTSLRQDVSLGKAHAPSDSMEICEDTPSLSGPARCAKPGTSTKDLSFSSISSIPPPSPFSSGGSRTFGDSLTDNIYLLYLLLRSCSNIRNVISILGCSSRIP